MINVDRNHILNLRFSTNKIWGLLLVSVCTLYWTLGLGIKWIWVLSQVKLALLLCVCSRLLLLGIRPKLALDEVVLNAICYRNRLLERNMIMLFVLLVAKIQSWWCLLSQLINPVLVINLLEMHMPISLAMPSFSQCSFLVLE